jgi:Rps23 Pro-64 3,4-dihydroxylase Tpa1-like proline 4-hydroxylase
MTADIQTATWGAAIAAKLAANEARLRTAWQASGPVRHCYLDGLLSEEDAHRIWNSLPDPATLQLRDTAKERKRVGIKLENYAPEMSAILFAFQDPAVIQAVHRITALEGMEADASLYGSGVSLMAEGDFLLPHLDNSHDGDGKRYRVLNTLYYVTPDWPEDNGGNLELWDHSMKERVEVHARFNRLVLMETHTDSIHSVNKVTVPGGLRACISNYYFSTTPANKKEHIHKTTFFARPEDGTARKLALKLEGTAKNFLSKFLGNGVHRTKHRRP